MVEVRGWTNRSRILFALLVSIWGLNYLFVRVGLLYSPPLWLAALRAGLGALGVVAVLPFVPNQRALDWPGRRDALLLGIPTTAVFFGLWFVAASSVPPGETAVVIYTFPLWVALLSSPVLGHRFTSRHWISVAAGFFGVVLVSQPWALSGVALSPLILTELLGGAISWAIGTVYFQRRFRGDEMQAGNAYQLIGGAMTLLIASALFERGMLPANTIPFWATLAWLGIVGTALAYAIWFSLLAQQRAATAAAYLFLVPVVALGASAVLFGDRLNAVQLGGVALVLASIYGISFARIRLPLAGPAMDLDERDPGSEDEPLTGTRS